MNDLHSFHQSQTSDDLFPMLNITSAYRDVTSDHILLDVDDVDCPNQSVNVADR
jgi:hypothetical protein